MRTVHKFPLPPARIGEPHTVQMPEGATVLRVALGFVDTETDRSIFLWALVDTEKPMVPRHFQVVGTGWEQDFTGAYIGTVDQGRFVWHVFEQQVRTWTPWAGGDCPVLGFVNVDYRLRDGGTGVAPAGGLRWSHDDCGGADIVAYRESDEQPDR